MTDMNEKEFRCGLVALAGLPNAGKSTLMNCLVGQKLSITSHKPQTTRNAIQGIKTTDDYQIIYVDTPGYHAGKGKLNKAMIEQTREVIISVDLICVVADPSQRATSAFMTLIEKVKESGAPHILVLTKVDDRSKEDIFKSASNLSKLSDFKEVIPVSARTGANIDLLEKTIGQLLPEQHPFYGMDEVTTQKATFLIGEFIREKAFELLMQEIPYSVLVEVEQVKERKKSMDIVASIIVAKESQKGIVIGKNASMIKEIGIRARKDLENYFGLQIRLDLFVKVRSWENNDEFLKIQGLY